MKKKITIRAILLIVLAIIGIVLISTYFFDWLDFDKNTLKFCSKLGEIILVSSIVSFLIDAARYIGIFKEELCDVIYDTKFLEKRKDIDKVWMEVSKVLFRLKFPQISTDLLMAVKNYYTPSDCPTLSYYNDYRIIYTIEYDEIESDFVRVNTKVSFNLNVENDGEFIFPVRFWTCVEQSKKDEVKTEIASITVNGSPMESSAERSEYANGMVLNVFDLVLKGSTEYRIEHESNKKYNLKDDNYLGFKARWLVKDMRVQLFHPTDMKILLVERGTKEMFKLNYETNIYKEYEYKGLVLKKQGFIMILNKY